MRQIDQPIGGQAFRCQCPCRLAQPGAGKPRIGVARVLDGCKARSGAGRPQLRLGNAEQRPQQAQPVRLPHRRHAGQSIRSAALGEAEQHGFGLVVAGVCQQQMGDAAGGAGVAQQPVPRCPGLRLAGVGWWVLPGQHGLVDGMGRQGPGHLHGFAAGFRPQSVVDRQGQDRTATCLCPAMGQPDQRQAVGTAGHPDRQSRRRLEGAERHQQFGEGTVIQWATGAWRQADRRDRCYRHCSRSRSCSARRRTATVAFGWSAINRPNVSQAVGRWPMAACDMPSFSRLSTTLEPFGNSR